MYPEWYEREMDQVEQDYADGLISNQEFNNQRAEIDEALYQYDAEALGDRYYA